MVWCGTGPNAANLGIGPDRKSTRLNSSHFPTRRSSDLNHDLKPALRILDHRSGAGRLFGERPGPIPRFAAFGPVPHQTILLRHHDLPVAGEGWSGAVLGRTRQTLESGQIGRAHV